MHEFRHPNIIEISYQEKYTSLPFNLQKPYKAQVQITRIHNNKFKVDFRLISGNNKRFVRTFQKIQVRFMIISEFEPNDKTERCIQLYFDFSNIWSAQELPDLIII